ncbi:major facilitator superfamily domain-containing protein, partial [Staphylotrichum tortipilum]
MAGLAVCRALLGVFEAGFFPAAVYLISKWYPPSRTYSASAASGAFSGLLAATIAKMGGLGNLEPWRWIFILESIASVLIGASCFFCLPDSPSPSKWLTPDESRFLCLMHDATRGRIEEDRKKADTKKTLVRVVKDWQLYLHAIIFNGVGIPLYGVKFTMPQIVKNVGFTSTNAQLMTAPPYVVAAFSSLLCAWFSDKYKWRMPFMVVPQIVTLIGFAILYAVSDKLKDNIALAYFCLFIVCAGTYPTLPGINSWSSDNLAGPAKRAIGLGFMIMMGNVSGFGGSYLFIASEAPRYPTAYGVLLGLLCVAIVMSVGLDGIYWTINKRRQAMTREEIAAKYMEAPTK